MITGALAVPQVPWVYFQSLDEVLKLVITPVWAYTVPAKPASPPFPSVASKVIVIASEIVGNAGEVLTTWANEVKLIKKQIIPKENNLKFIASKLHHFELSIKQ